MGKVRQNTADIIDWRSIRKIFGYNIGGVVGEDIGFIVGFSRVWEEGTGETDRYGAGPAGALGGW